MVSEYREDFGMGPAMSGEQVQRVRQSKGNQELNDELKMKANELEKLFAEHKLRIPGERSSYARRNKLADMQMELAASLPNRKLPAEIAPAQLPDKNVVTEPRRGSSHVPKFSVTPPMKKLDNQNYGDSLKQNFSNHGFPHDSRGKFYERYMQKRDAKLREELDSKRPEKEAKMKALHDRFERSRAEMKAKFSRSSDRQDSVLSARRAERLRSFNTKLAMKRGEHPIDHLRSEDEEDLSDFAEQIPFGHGTSFFETSLGDSAAKSTQNKKILPNKNVSSSTPHTSVSVPRLTVKASNSISGRRRMQSENSLAQSVPNSSDLRKENTKPSSGVSRTTSQSQEQNYARSKSTNEEIPLAKEGKPRRSQSLRESSASPAEFKDISMDSEGIVLTPLKFDKEKINDLYDKFPKNVKSKPFLRKGTGIGPNAGDVIAKMKLSMASETMNNGEKSDELAFETEESVDAIKDEEEEEPEVMITENQANMDNGRPRLNQEFDKLVNSGSESGDALRYFSQVDPPFVADFPVSVPSTFQPAGSMQDSPAESPVSWNSRVQHAFSYDAHEISDINASVDTPMGNPASWNSHSLNQAEADAARMRKKWGNAQKPLIVSNSSNIQSRKDVTKGFNRLLKFDWRSRGTESSVDWISATTSEGDDDTEDGRDPANRSSEDLRKSRMRFSQGHTSDDCFNKSQVYSEQVQVLHNSIPTPPVNYKLREDHLSGSSIKAPRSFFSLSSFRSKGNNSKPR